MPSIVAACLEKALVVTGPCLGLTLPGLAQTWTLVSGSGPIARSGHAMAFDDQRGRTVLFGGFGNGTFLADTWEWDGSTWNPRSTAAGPAVRDAPAMAYDGQRGRVVLFGGWHPPSQTYYGDTWEWDGVAWTQVSSTGPSARTRHSMVYDSHRGRAVLHGGKRTGGFIVGDTWEWDGSVWVQAAANGPVRNVFAACFDAQRQRTVLFGGSSATANMGDTWEWDGSAWSLMATSGPAARNSTVMVYDDRIGRSVLFGGYGVAAPTSYFADTWEWDGSVWTQVVGSGPSGRGTHAMAYDAQRGRAVLFGGIGTNNPPTPIRYGDTWEWNGNLASSAASFGSGCGSPALTLSPVGSSPPILGSTARVSVTSIPSAPAFLTIGLSRSSMGAFQLPLGLAQFGMPGCELLQSAESGLLPTSPTGPSSASFGMAVPNYAGFLGLHVYLQAGATDPAANAAGVIVSNGVEWGIGSF